MVSASIKRRVATFVYAAAALLVNVRCISDHPKTPWDGLPLIHSVVPFPTEWRNKMREIGRVYIRHYHDCDDMAQEFADYLHRWFAWEDMRYTWAWGPSPLLQPHAWLEVWWDGYWWINDPTIDKLMWRFLQSGREASQRPVNWKDYTFVRYLPSDEVYNDGTGYLVKGAVFRNGLWSWPTAK